MVFIVFFALDRIGMHMQLSGFQAALPLTMPAAAATFTGLAGTSPGERIFNGPGFIAREPGRLIRTAGWTDRSCPASRVGPFQFARRSTPRAAALV